MTMTKRLSFLTCLGLLFIASSTFAQITVTNSASLSFGTAPLQQADYTLPGFDAGASNKLVVGFGVEAGYIPDFSVTFGGTPLTSIIASSDLTNPDTGAANEFTALFFLDGAAGVGDIVVTTGSTTAPNGFGNGPGIYAAALSGAAPGVETSGRFGHETAHFGDLTGTLTGVGNGSYVLASFTDQGRNGDQTVTGDLTQVSVYSGADGDQIGSAVSIAASGFGNGSDLTATFNDLTGAAAGTGFQDRGNFSFASFAPVPEPSSTLLLMSGIVGIFAVTRRRR